MLLPTLIPTKKISEECEVHHSFNIELWRIEVVYINSSEWTKCHVSTGQTANFPSWILRDAQLIETISGNAFYNDN